MNSLPCALLHEDISISISYEIRAREGIIMKNPYDVFYRQFDMTSKPFGYSSDYFIWRTSKIKGEIAKSIKKDGLILDVGGGFGVMVKYLPKYVDVNNYINLDISIEMLKNCSYQNILTVAEHIPFYDDSFDYVIMSEVLTHVNDKIMSLKECYRILKTRGLLLLTTPRIRAEWIRDYKKSPFIVFLIADWVIKKIMPRNPTYKIPKGIKNERSDEAWLRETLEKIGFTILKQYREDNHVPWSNSGEARFWRWFSDQFVKPRKFGHCTVVICEK